MKCVTQVLESLSGWQQITYGAAVVTRMMPNMELFCEVYQRGQEAVVVRNIVQLVWEFAAGDNSSIHFLRQQDKLDAVTPNPAQFDSYGVWPALDAATALFTLLSACHQFDIEEINSLSKLSQATIAHFLQVTEDTTDIEDHPLIVADQAFAFEVIELLKDDNKTRKKRVTTVKSLFSGPSISNIGVSVA